jgi:hypothetical protein
MRIPSNSELIAIWERGSGEDSVGRALMLLCACFDEPRDELERLSVGSRDGRLLEIYERLFGPALDAFAECPACKQPLEYSLSTRDLVAPHPPRGPSSLTLKTEEACVRLRLPDSLDLRAAATCSDLARAGRLLMDRCIVAAELDGQSVSPKDVPDQLRDSISIALAAADPQADMLIDLNCSACTHHWQVTLDIEPFLWSKICAVAKRLLREVHALAAAYGWREHDILGLSPVRRQTYVEMAWPTF